MRNQNGYTPLTWILIITIALLIGGVSIAMIFGNTDIVHEITESVQNIDAETNTTNTNIETGTQENKS